MSTPYLGEMRIMSFNFAPKGWAQCNGQFLPINQNQALFSLLGTQYGGNGQTTFALPDLRGRVPIHQGQSFIIGQAGGQETHTIIMSEMPAHNHVPQGNSAVPNTGSPANAFWCDISNNSYSTAGAGNTTLAPGAVTNTGGSQPHNNLQPFLVLNICIALQGIFPSRN
jgi:microcystin-dependent protein